VVDNQNRSICHIANIHAPATYQDKFAFLENLHSLPFFDNIDSEPWMLFGDFNTAIHIPNDIPTRLKPWYRWIKDNFIDSFFQHYPTFIRGDSRTTIDFLLTYRSLAPRITNSKQHFLLSEWTNHVMLCHVLIYNCREKI
jgi:hypothetical protein